MKVAIYARVPTKKQDGTNQLPRLRETATNKGYEIYHEYTDEASARDANRPGWKDLMADVSERKFDAILITKLDRVMRSLVQLNITMADLLTYGVRLICLDQGEIDPSTPMGKMQMQLIDAIAEWEREIIVQRTKEGIEAKRVKGVRLGRKKRDDISVETLAALRSIGKSWNGIAIELHVPKTTILRRKEAVALYISRPKKEVPE